MPTLNLELSRNLDSKLDAIAKRSGIPKIEAVRRAFALLIVADEERQRNDGSSVGIVRRTDDDQLEAICPINGL